MIRDFLREHVNVYRFVLMADIWDSILQADPFRWMPSTANAHSVDRTIGQVDLQRSIIFSGEGAGSVPTLRASKKGRARTMGCAGAMSETDRGVLLDTVWMRAFRCPSPMHAAQHGAARRSTARHVTARHSTAQHGTAWHSMAQHVIKYVERGPPVHVRSSRIH